ncbi:cell division protein FtsQ/DivIB [Nocardioides sp.]|uniref:cell division protein FtsQ/DivIB n=1 Tax=Nocardioides sp. TaxID=35761 RepID=UPI0027339BA4|nr:FtsQ-type POTRA domain-containing protein [Nocardioides sp.]MDP3892623.1 FtsQ-type POTRA domain-containing protein [Nocardioides sp.]
MAEPTTSSRRPGPGAGSPAVTTPALERTRRRFLRRQRARRWLAWRVVLATVVGLAGVVGACWLLFFSQFLSVAGVEVRGTSHLSPEEVVAVAGIPTGEPLARIDLDRVESRVGSLAAVRSVAVSRAWPDEILVEVEERVAIAVVELGGRLRGMDADGVVFRDFAQPPRALPRITTDTVTRREALTEGARVIAALPGSISRSVDHVEVRTVDQISLVLGDGRRVEWGSAEQSGIKARVLPALLQREARTYDVSVPGQPTTK